MKKYINTLKASVAKLDDEITERDRVHDARTFAWQESAKGEDYARKTEHLVEIRDQHNELIEFIQIKIDE